jgi:pimeloyl-ACP methyl ester carboxylesterase
MYGTDTGMPIAYTLAADHPDRLDRLVVSEAPLPGLSVLAIGGAEGGGEGPANTMKLATDDVQTVVLAGSGHWVAEQAPEELLEALTAFLAPYRDGENRE